MSEIHQKFIHWYFNEFQLSPLYEAMANTVEGSPWHRERNVGVHTDMVVSQYLATNDGPFDVRGAIGCAFHDVGKPPAEIEKYSEARGHYRAYHGHELVSARMWEDWAVQNWTFLSNEFNLVPYDIYVIGWMIEHHVPWMHKKESKLNAFAVTAFETLGYDETWIDMLMADQLGRISDDSHKRAEECEAWLSDLYDRVAKAEHRWKTYGDKMVYMLIGAPGCGKSTYRAKLLEQHPNAAVVSMDDLRLEWYGDDYDAAWLASTKDKRFAAKVDSFYVQTLRDNNVVIIDNTNTVAKQRNRWLAPARARDFQITASVFPVDLKTIVARQKTRTDHSVPTNVVTNMYNRQALPLYGDFDDVVVVSDNL